MVVIGSAEQRKPKRQRRKEIRGLTRSCYKAICVGNFDRFDEDFDELTAKLNFLYHNSLPLRWQATLKHLENGCQLRIQGFEKSLWAKTDGGRRKAGHWRPYVGDCVTRAISIAMSLPYKVVWEAFKNHGINPNRGVDIRIVKGFFEAEGWNCEELLYKNRADRLTVADLAKQGQDCVVHCMLFRSSSHLVAIKDGQYLIQGNQGGLKSSVYDSPSA